MPSTVNDTPVAVFVFLMLTMFKYDRFRRRRFDPAEDMQDLHSKVAIVTGGSAGIGYGTVKHLARRGATVYIASRDEFKANRAIESLKVDGLEPGNGHILFLCLDLTNFQNVKNAAEEFISKETRLDILVNNAGLLLSDPAQEMEGILDYMHVNHLSPFLFTKLLLPLLKRTAEDVENDVRIINVSSDAMLYAPPTIRFRDIDDFNIKYNETRLPWYARYCASKLANVLFAKELQRQFDAEGIPIIAISLHPGNVNTFSEITPYPRIAKFIMGQIFMPPDVGAHTSAFAAAAPCVKLDNRYKGCYLQPIARLGKETVTSCDEKLAAELWDTTERLLNKILY